MADKVIARLDCTFVLAGIAKASKKPYLQVSDGVEAKFVSVPKTIDEGLFVEWANDLERGDSISIEVEIDPFRGRMDLVAIPE